VKRNFSQGKFFIIAFILLLPSTLLAWGYFAHKWIHREAIPILPEPLRRFYQSVADSVMEKSNAPDLRRKYVQNEEFHHYIDIDYYGRFPFNELPRDYRPAAHKFTADTLLANGDAPWHIAHVLDSLTSAMRNRKIKQIVDLSADLGHYVADLHMPLHTTLNHDGQFSDNTGIHSRFERYMIERYANQIHLNPGLMDSIANPVDFAFEIVLDSYIWSDNLLRADTRARDPQRPYERREDFDDVYYGRFFAFTSSIAERQMSAAARDVASYWYTAWLRAGRPQLVSK
jgi:hypothetical protein